MKIIIAEARDPDAFWRTFSSSVISVLSGANTVIPGVQRVAALQPRILLLPAAPYESKMCVKTGSAHYCYEYTNETGFHTGQFV